jgi:hypothetical protein
LISILLAAALAGLAAPARADVPSTIPFAGRLVKNGTPVSGAATVAFRLFAQQSGGASLWEETQSLGVDQGLVYARLGSVNPIDPTIIKDSLFLEVEVLDGTSAGPFQPRLPVESVPFAIHAQTADTLGDLAPDRVQVRVDKDCPAGSSIRAIAADGSVTCEIDDDTPAPTYTGTGAITVSGTAIGLSNTGCAAGDVWKWNGSAWSCDPDTTTTYTGTGAITVSGTAIGLSNAGCAAGDVWKWNGAAWACDPDVDTNTTYTGTGAITISGTAIGLSSAGCAAGDVWKWNGSAWSCDPDSNTAYTGTGAITVSGTAIGLSSAGCSAGDVWKWNGSAWACAPDLNTSTTYTGAGAITVSGTSVGLSTSGCAAGDVWKWSGAAWSCDPDSNTAYAAGAGLAINGTTIGLASSGCSAGDVWKWTGASWACTPDLDTNTTYVGSGPITVTGTTVGLSASGCAAGDVWKWTGTTWACSADSNTAYTGAAPISVTGTTVALTPCPANQIYKMNAAGTGFACAPDANTAYSAGTGVDISGTTVSLSTAGCSPGYVWKYNGTSFACAPDGTPGLATFYASGSLRPNAQNQVAHVTVNAPTSGNLLATLSYGLAVRNNATACNVPLKLSLTSGDLSAGEGFQQYFWPNSIQTMDSGTGYGTWPASITAAFPVSAGSRTVFFNSGQIGAPNCGDFLWTNVTLTVMFVPNSISGGVGAP